MLITLAAQGRKLSRMNGMSLLTWQMEEYRHMVWTL